MGRLVGLHLPLWMISLEEGPDPRHASWVLLGVVSGLAVLAAAGQHRSPGPLSKPGLSTAHCAQPCGSCCSPSRSSLQVWALRGLLQRSSLGVRLCGQCSKARIPFFFRTEKNSPSTEKEVLFL